MLSNVNNMDTKLNKFLNQYNLTEYVEKFERLPGGLMNFTYRLHFNNVLEHTSTIKLNDNDNFLILFHKLKPKSLIAKVTYPYIAHLGPEFPYPLIRQMNEKRALQLLNNNLSHEVDKNMNDLSSIFNRHKTLKISRVWIHDEENNILIIEDQGQLETMKDWFISTNNLLNKSIMDTIHAYGVQLANFVIDLQISSIKYVNYLKPMFNTVEAHKADFLEIPGIIENIRANYDLHHIDELWPVVSQYYQQEISDLIIDGRVFAHGDIWSSNILINENDSTLTLLDWEWAGIRSPAHDPGTFLSHCHVQMLVNPSNEGLLCFLNTFTDTYRENAQRHKVSWYENEQEKYSFAWILGALHATNLLFWTTFLTCCSTEEKICCHRRCLVTAAVEYARKCQSGPNKTTYDSMLNDKLFGRLFHAI
ncbi:unnamed protein product [Adineta ricciae]|uniref:Aminoglycoside phosphotransferase domain-containing protein n=1 Tax=Adineta ricciae TaxID=249248 RepID=A0A815LBR2_ADIRI|nr:unnamed protein product [Adineta ricciae]CAF1405845.1 unnamed protein product [Adineta ricciae]